MRVLVLGAGAVGCSLGGALAQAGHQVTFVTRPGRAAELSHRGIRLRTAWGQFDLAALDVRERVPGGAFDYVLLAVKAYDVPPLLDQLAQSGQPGHAILVTLQNGLGTEEAVMERFPEARLLAGAVTLAIDRTAGGEFHVRNRRGGLGLSAATGGAGPLELVESLRRQGLTVRTYPDWRTLKWSKLLLNLQGNASSAILDWPPPQIFNHAGLFRLERAATLEAVAVMRRLGLRPHNLPGQPVALLVWAYRRLPGLLMRPVLARQAHNRRGGKPPSLGLDRQAGRRQSEVGWLNGAVARWGEELGVETPANRALTQVLLGVLSGELHGFLENPGALLSVYHRERTRYGG